MKKLTYLVIATAALGMVACTGGNKAGYVVTGTVEGANDGDTEAGTAGVGLDETRQTDFVDYFFVCNFKSFTQDQ